MVDFDSLPDEASDAPLAPVAEAPADASSASTQAPALGDFDSLVDDNEKYSSPEQQAKAGIEGVAKGVAGPLATLAETKVLGVKPEDILGREKANPWTSGVGQAAGLAGGLLTGTGEAAIMGGAGKMALEAAGLGEGLATASTGYKVGSAAVQQAAEMAVLQGGDEASKLILQDPDASAQSAIANIGLSAAFGAGGGAFMSGVVSPLWEATAGPKVTEFLSGLKNHLDGTRLQLPEDIQQSLNTLGFDVGPATKAALSGDPKAAEIFNELRESQHPEILKDISNLRKASSDSVLASLGVAPEAVENYSENQAGHDLSSTFRDEYEKKYQPVADALEERNSIASTIPIGDEARMDQYGKVIEKGMSSFGTDSPLYKVYSDWGNRILAKESIGGMDALKTEIGGELKKAYRSGDDNMVKALNEIKGSISEFQEKQINKAAAESVASGGNSKAVAADILSQRAAANAGYAKFAGMSNDLAGHLGVGEFRGFGKLTNKLENGVSPELLLKKFSPKNNADIIPFLQEHFPETAEAVRQNEVKQLIKPAVIGAKGEEAIDMNKLSKTIKTGLAGKSDYIKWAMPSEALSKIDAADKLAQSLPSFKSSGTAGWMQKLSKHMPSSAMAGIGLLMGHSPIAGALIGEAAQRLGHDAPDAIKLGLLKYMASDQPIKAEGFKSMVEFFHNSSKGESLMTRAIGNTIKGSSQVLTASQMPNQADRDKLDKVVQKVQDKPEIMMNMANGHVGHYLPQHQQALAQTQATAIQYLQALKPKPVQNNPLDRPIEPSAAQQARYNRALDIAQQPNIVMQHIQDGTLQATDIQDLHNMYPAVYQRMSAKLSAAMSNRQADEEPITYKTRMGMSLFLGQPLDGSMTPANILAAQPQPQQAPPQQAKGRPSKVNAKSTNTYRTPNQAAEADRSSRD